MSRSLLARSLEPLVATLWGFLLAWTVLLAIVWVGCVDARHLSDWVQNEGLRKTLIVLVESAVPAWLALALANLHLALTRAEGLATTRRWLGLGFVAAFAFGLLATRFGLSGTRLHFIEITDRLGPKLTGIPIGWPLLWIVLAVGGRELVLWVRPRASHLVTVLAGAVLVGLAFLNLEPLAAASRWQWWYWYRGAMLTEASPPWLFLLAFAAALGWLMRETALGRETRARSRRPAIVFLLLNLLLLATHLRLRFWPPPIPDFAWP
jgi:hypothetical protein